jgi:hypothetical protein
MSLLSSPRRRRRLAWAGGLVAVVGLFLAVNAVLPSHGGRIRALPTETSARTSFGPSTAEVRAAERSAKVVRPLANAYAAKLGAGAPTVVFSGRTTVGLVASASKGNSERLYAIRFDKVHGRWRVAYTHQGTASSRVDQQNFAPAGFEPGSRRETAWTWLALGLGLIGLVAVVALLDRRLSAKPAASH